MLRPAEGAGTPRGPGQNGRALVGLSYGPVPGLTPSVRGVRRTGSFLLQRGRLAPLQGGRQRSTSPRMNASTASRASLSLYCTGGLFMK
jgi:hypothetical protein